MRISGATFVPSSQLAVIKPCMVVCCGRVLTNTVGEGKRRKYQETRWTTVVKTGHLLTQSPSVCVCQTDRHFCTVMSVDESQIYQLHQSII